MSESSANNMKKINIEQFSQIWTDNWRASQGCLPQIEHDCDYPSPCEVGQAKDGELISWQPVARSSTIDLNNINQALEFDLHPSVVELFCRQFSGNLSAQFDGNWLEIIQPWNEEDFERLQENLIAHHLMKRKLKQRPSSFIAVTDDDMLIISILNETGEVVLEPVGKEPSRVLAPDLGTFLAQLTPVMEQD
ncbi:SecY-interacting protein [Saccharobesus litoralis]|uniref:Protein Syd n=1 Tax=Saccharobesus litoralis TaxID=2172099 RepID=A0A2S0VMA5_9ALTE|nr:SecY-interacting protein [Saccharobesus litoralis]AWB65240.1 SecY-interacting protein [Saccharobesus litoralis]